MAPKRAGDDKPKTTSGKATQAAGANGDKPGAARRGDKTEAVKEALAQGITSPTEIADHVRRQHGLEITPGHVTTIKGTLKRKQQGTAQPSATRASRPEQPAATQGEQPAVRPVATSSAPCGLTPRDLAAIDTVMPPGAAAGLRYPEVMLRAVAP